MYRRSLLAEAAAIATLGGCLASSPSDDQRNESTSEPDSDEAYNITITETDSKGPHRIGPSSPDCPVNEEGADPDDRSWGMMDRISNKIDEPVSSPEDAGRLFLEEYEYSDEARVAVARVDRIKWKEAEHNITNESATGDWYILNQGLRSTYLVIPASETSTIVREYRVGDC